MELQTDLHTLDRISEPQAAPICAIKLLPFIVCLIKIRHSAKIRSSWSIGKRIVSSDNYRKEPTLSMDEIRKLDSSDCVPGRVVV